MCSTEMEAPCIIDPGASCGALATLPPSLGLQLSWLPLVRVGERSIFTTLFPACSNVPEDFGSTNK